MHDTRAWARQWLQTPRNLYIDGGWRSASDARTLATVDPADQSTLTTYGVANEVDVEAAAAAARRASRAGDWPRMARRDRGKLLQRIAAVIRDHADELATLESLDNGKLLRESVEDDLPESADVFDYYAGWVDKHYGETCPVGHGFINYTVHEPVGACGLIVPWNFPLLMACWKLAMALACGNTVVIKPSEHTPLSLSRLFELLDERVALPPGVVNLVLGDGETGAAIARSPRLDKVAFTGSTRTGRAVLAGAAASNLKRVSLELGGKSPNILFADLPDRDAAVARVYAALFSHKGEKCSEPTRLLVQRPLYDNVVAELAAMAEAAVCGHPFAPTSQQGPQCHRAHFESVMRYVELGRAEGRLVAGGVADTRGENANGLFVRPTIFADVDNSARVAQEEIFGPVLVITPFEDEDEAVRLANETSYGLAAGLYTADVSRAHRVASRLDAGMVFVNRYGCYDFASPFGGFKQSGHGKELGRHSLAEFTRTKSIWIAL